MKRLLQLTLVLLITAGLTTVANAQTSINANADVKAAISITGSDLDFGTVIQGNNETVSPTNGGTFTISGTDNSDVNFQFTQIPSSLTDGSGNSLSISYNSIWENNSSSNNSVDTGQNVVNTATFDGDITVYLGGEVQPTASQATGNYTGTITLTASYN